MKPLLRGLLRAGVFFVVIIVILFTSLAIFKIPIEITSFKSPLENVVSGVLQRPVVIEKSITLFSSLEPAFAVEGLRIGNPDSFTQDTFLYLESAHIQIALLPLLKMKLHFSKIDVQKLYITLIEKEGGEVNWILSPEGETDNSQVEGETKSETRDETLNSKKQNSQGALSTSSSLAGDSIVIRQLNLEDIVLRYFSPGQVDPEEYKMSKSTGSMIPGKPLNLHVIGSLAQEPYELDISIASLEEFLKQNRSWMEIQGGIAKTDFTVKGNVDLEKARRSLSLYTVLSGEKLNTLNGLLELDLPPLLNYSVETDLFIKKDHVEMKNLEVKTGESSLQGTALVSKSDEGTSLNVQLQSPLTQLNDFLFDDWSWRAEDSFSESETDLAQLTEEKDTIDQPKKAPQINEYSKILDPEVLRRFDVRLDIESEKVLSGEDLLGGGVLHLSLKDGRIAVDPLKLHLPGGSIELAVSLIPGLEKSDAELRAVVQNFDIGVLARRKQPKTTMGGLVNLDIDLRSSAGTFDEILANGDGYFDFSGQLNNISAGLIDLWAVNLVSAIVSQTDKNQSNINCAVGRWSVKDGVLTPDAFFIDTSKIRICGKGSINFTTQRLNLLISPTAKRPEFFNLATPLRVRGSFAGINVGIKKGALVGTALKFITSPVHVPIRRVVTSDIPVDGNDACRVVLGAENREGAAVRGCR